MTEALLWSAHLTTDGTSRTVALAGELDLNNAGAVRRLLIAELDRPGTTEVVSDLTDVAFLDSAALGALINAYQRAFDTGQQFFVTNPTRAVKRILDITGLHDILVRNTDTETTQSQRPPVAVPGQPGA